MNGVGRGDGAQLAAQGTLGTLVCLVSLSPFVQPVLLPQELSGTKQHSPWGILQLLTSSTQRDWLSSLKI